jgi:FtsP/CotA-like multicopper oxidase with cupredoxin domain
MLHLRQGRCYRLRMRNASEEIGPLHLHRHSFELTQIGGRPIPSVMNDAVMVGAYATAHRLRLHGPVRLRLGIAPELRT